jgi:hypothetical protein
MAFFTAVRPAVARASSNTSGHTRTGHNGGDDDDSRGRRRRRGRRGSNGDTRRGRGRNR